MGPIELLSRVAPQLDATGIRYFVTGSVASGSFGEFRPTLDVDIVVVLSATNGQRLIALFPEDEFYVSAEAVRDAIEHASQFNVIQATAGLKIDFMVVADEGFQGSCLARRVRRPLGNGISAWFAAPDDLVLNKLLLYREGGSDKHLRDIVSMIKVSGEMMDLGYLEEWAARLDVADLWEVVRERAKGPPNV